MMDRETQSDMTGQGDSFGYLLTLSQLSTSVVLSDFLISIYEAPYASAIVPWRDGI